MRKIKYYFNPRTLRFERIEISFRRKVFRFLVYIGTAMSFGLVGLAITFKFIQSPREQYLIHENNILNQNYSVIKNRLAQLQTLMIEIEDRDNYVYKSIFEAFPLPDSARAKEMERANEVKLLENLNQSQLVASIIDQLNNLQLRIAYQKKSFNEIENLIKNKEQLISATPSIQPISNKQLNRITSGYGYRNDPILKTYKFHYGVDFVAPLGSPIYATAKGKVIDEGFKTDGFGIRVLIDHGFGYQTLYAHLIKTKAYIGQKVNRGDVIGYLGSTGRSTAPHLHYEVHKHNKSQNPIFYFYNELNQAEFDKIIQITNTNKQSFD